VEAGFKEALESHGKFDGKGVELLIKYEVQVNDTTAIDFYIYFRVKQKVVGRAENRFGIGIVKANPGGIIIL